MDRGRRIATAGAVAMACLVLAGCGGSKTAPRKTTTTAHTPGGSVLATATSAGHGLERFSAPGMGLHFLYPEIFQPFRPAQPSQSEGAASNSVAFAEVGLNTRDGIFVVDVRHPKQRVTRANAVQQQGGLDAAIDALTESESASTIHYAHGDVVYEWPAVIAPTLPDNSTDQYTEIYTPADEYELECISDPANRARVNTACAEALASFTTSGS